MDQRTSAPDQPRRDQGGAQETESDPPAGDDAPKGKQPDPDDRKGSGNEDAPDKPGQSTDDGPAQPSFLRRHPWLVLAGVLGLLAAIVGGVLWWRHARHFESTDDAFIDARQFAISPKVAGFIVDVPVTDNQFVDAGGLIAQIDPIDYQIALAQAEARRKAAGDQIVNLDAQVAAQEAQVQQAQAQVQQVQASLTFAQQQFSRATQLRQSGAGTVQSEQQQQSSLQSAESDMVRAQAAVTAAQKQILVLQAQRASANADLSEAKAARDQAQVNLGYTTIRAAQAGRVARLTAAKGQYVQPGQNLMMFVPDALWVTANFKETQITDMRPGQPVAIRVDSYPDRKLRGHVESIQAGSGTAFSLLPAENATGNYVKVVQRIPVKIVFDDLPHDLVLGPGMSVVPRVTVR